jgi:hypothetical protein
MRSRADIVTSALTARCTEVLVAGQFDSNDDRADMENPDGQRGRTYTARRTDRASDSIRGLICF